MAAADDLRALNNAPSQLDRARAAPQPGRVKVDGRSLADLLAFAAEYGTLITFYDLSNQPDGDWSAFFVDDPSIALALRAALNPADIQAEFDRLLDALRGATTPERRAAILRQAFEAVERLARLLTGAGAEGAGIERALTSLGASDRRELLAVPARRIALHLGGNSPEHGLRHDRDDWFPQLIELLDTLAVAMVTALDQDRPAAAATLEASFLNQTHPAQSALYDAFARLFGHAQKSINRFPERLIQFYQSEILHQTSRAAAPDSLSLTFTPAKGVTRAELPRGTRFLAGTDGQGETIAYALDAALSVDAASVTALRTLTVTSGLLPGAKLPIPAQVLSGVVALADKAPSIATPFPLFGATGASGVLTTTEASLGFAVASPTLLLAGGSRAVTLALMLTPESLAAVTATLETLAVATGGMAPSDIFVRLLQAGLALRYSTAGGWIDVVDYQVTPVADDYPLFALTFVLSPDAEPFVPLSTKPAAKKAVPPAKDAAVPDWDSPTLIADLLQEPVKLGRADAAVDVYPYALLSEMKLSAVTIYVDVVGLEDLQVSSPSGPVETGKPFLLFGSPPVQGAALDIAAPELFVKPVGSFGLNIEWFGLPVTSDGFYGYYHAYVVNADGQTRAPGSLFDNQSFTARLEVSNPGWWKIADTPQFLFRTSPNDPVPAKDEALHQETALSESVEAHVPPAYYSPASSAVRLRLDQPDTGFGNILYAPNVMAASLRLTATASACAQQCSQQNTLVSRSSPPAPVMAAKVTAPDATLDQAVEAAVQRAAANPDDAAVKAIEDAIAGSDATPDVKAVWSGNLAAALGTPTPAWRLRRLVRWRPVEPDSAAVQENLRRWLAANEAGIAAALSGPTAAAVPGEVRTGLAGEPPASDCVEKCMENAHLLGFPNQPWLPMAASLRVDYSAAIAIPPPAGAVDPVPATFYRLLPFDGIEAVAWGEDGEALLSPIGPARSLLIGLSDPAETLTLLFRLAPPADGWPPDTPAVSWAQSAGETGWTPLKPLRDTTEDLSNTGIVSLALADPAAAPLWLRLGVPGDSAAFPMLAGLTTNAARASWVGPGGGAGLGRPLAAGTVTKAAVPLPNIGSIDQPMPSSGGAPAQTGTGFEMWLAERLRHKDRAIQSWDYSNLLLAAFPSLWQVAVVPATDGGSDPLPGNVWVVAVPGPDAAGADDPTVPSIDSSALGEFKAFLERRISPFIELKVTNPPYLRITVHAELLFTDGDSAQANIERLNGELVQFLSPWPPAALPPRPRDYYTRNEIVHFIRRRPYVRAILSLAVTPDVAGAGPGWHYLTSASSHCLHDGASETALPHDRSPPRRLPAPFGGAR